MLPAPHPQPMGVLDSLRETVQVQDVPGLRSAVDGGQEWKGTRDREGRGGVAMQRHPRLMSGEQRTTGDRAEREERQR